MKRFGGLVLFLLLAAGTVSAQGYKLTGKITDADDNSEMISTSVVASPIADSTKWQGTLTGVDGQFVFNNLPNGTYKLKINSLGYLPLVQTITINGADVNTGIIKMAKNAKVLSNVDIVENQVRVEQKDDTTEYNAKAYKTNPDATAEDLVTKMPGITSENGTIKAHGEEVKKVTIDGKDFFGDDASLALKNLPSEVVDKVQIFDKQSDQAQFTGFDDGNSQKGMNIITKNGLKNALLGKVYAGYGYLNDSKYTAGLTLNWFNGDRRLSVLAMSNNVNQQNFASQDLLGLQSNSGGRGGRRGGPQSSGAGNFLVNQQNGIATTHAAGLNYVDTWGKLKKVKVTGSYFFNLADNKNSTQLNRQYFNTGDSSTYYNEDNTTTSRNINHRINLRLQYDIDSNNSFIFTPSFSTQQNTKENDITGINTTAENALLSRTNSIYTSANKGYDFSTDILFRHKFKKPRRTISLSATPSLTNKTGTTTQYASNQYSDTDSSVTDQQATNASANYSIKGSVRYTEPAGKTGMVMLNYDVSYSLTNSDKETFNRDSILNSYTALDTLLSSKYNNAYMTHRAGVAYRLKGKKLSLMAAVNGQYAQLTGSNDFPTSYNTNRQFYNVLPMAMFDYKFSTASNLHIFYRASTSAPSISQLQSVVDNSNTLLLSTGNPSLKQSYSNFAVLRYGITNTAKAQSFFLFATANYTQNYIGNSTFIASADTVINGDVLLRSGSQISRPVNINGYVTANVFLTYGVAIPKIKCNLNLNAGFAYTRTPSLINDIQNLSNTYNVNAGFVLGSNISEKIDFTLSYSANYNIVKNSLQKNSDNNYFNHSANVKFNWMFWKGFVFNTSLQNTLYAGIADGYNQNIFLWNAGLGYKFLKDQSLDVRLNVNDILNQNNGISRTVTDTYIEDSKSTVLKRYLMLTVTYSIKHYGKKS